MTKPHRQPALFLGHGSPMTMITDNPERRAMELIGSRLWRPDAIVAVTAHWETRNETRLSSASMPKTIHDFRGFPVELYNMQYPAPGSPALAERMAGIIGPTARLDTTQGFDHGVWGVLLPLLPAADIPVVAMSVDMTLSGDEHLALGKKLAPLREENVLVVGSGNIIHNLAMWRESAGTQPEWALEFRDRSNAAIRSGDDRLLTRFAPDDQHAAWAINSGEHYAPLLYALGARLPGDDVTIFSDTVDGSLSMTSVLWGDAALADGLQ